MHRLHHLRFTDTDIADESLYLNKSKSCSYLVVTQNTTHVHRLIDLAKWLEEYLDYKNSPVSNWIPLTSTYWLSRPRELEVIPVRFARTVCLTGSFMLGLWINTAKLVAELKFPIINISSPWFTSYIISVSSVLSLSTVLKMMLVSWCWPARRRPPSSSWETSVRGSGAQI